MRIIIVPVNFAVHVDGVFGKFKGADIPTDVHALQWYEDKGWIEYKHEDPFGPRRQNEIIEELPAWALDCVTKMEPLNEEEEEL